MDYKIINRNDITLAVDKSKIFREKCRLQKELLIPNSNEFITGLYFDGRRDKTLCNEKINNKYYKRTVIEDHISFVQEPGSSYLGHTTSSSGYALTIYQSIWQYFQESNTDISRLRYLKVIGCDGTVVNTGKKFKVKL